jgi:carboxypeptidase Taq
VAKIGASPNPVDDSFFVGEWDKEQQRLFTEQMVQKVGFSFERGRQDVAPHPFCTNFSIGDVRLTTRYLNHLASAIMSSMHEAGHGMYEQGSPMDWDRTPLAGGVSLGVHESQSRLWENIVGRSRPFWSYFLPILQRHFPTLSGVDADQFYRGINKVQPSYIRVEADEVTYNLHIMIRFEIECAVLTKELAVKDIPGVWNEKMQSYFGLTPKSDSEGCLQDVHWSAGLIGYFPTYTVGNLLSYQIWKALTSQISGTEEKMAAGDFGQIFNWLRENIYAHGQRFTPKELVQRVTGKPMGADDLIAGLTSKYSEIYGL